MFSCSSKTASNARSQFGPRAEAKRACAFVVARAQAKTGGDDVAKTTTTIADPNLACSRRGALLSAVAAAPLASVFFSSFVSPATAAAAPKKLPKLDAIKLYGSQEKAEAARAAAVAGVKATLASVDPSAAGVLLRMAFHDPGTWDGKKMTGGANGSILNELERPENGGLKYGAALLGLARKAQELPRGVKQLSDADFIQVAGAVAVEVAGGPKIEVPLGRPDLKSKAGDPAGQLPGKDLDAAGLIALFSSNGYSVREHLFFSLPRRRDLRADSSLRLPLPLPSHPAHTDERHGRPLRGAHNRPLPHQRPEGAHDKDPRQLLKRLLCFAASRRRRLPVGPHPNLRCRDQEDRRRIQQEQGQVLRGFCRGLRADGPEGARGLKGGFFFSPGFFPGFFGFLSRGESSPFFMFLSLEGRERDTEFFFSPLRRPAPFELAIAASFVR